jgi:60 kDa SS-A/Ro ribonucleoprotein
MAQLNIKVPSVKEYTHEGAVAVKISPEKQLRRTVMTTLLWEDNFYEDGQSVADRIKTLVNTIKPDKVAEIAIEAREKQKLRHVPLLLLRELARNGTLKAETLTHVIQRPDEITEFVAMYWKDNLKDGKLSKTLSRQVKKGLQAAFDKFDEYSLAKYNRDNAVKLRDVAFLVHVKGKSIKREDLYARLLNKDYIPNATKNGNLICKSVEERTDGKVKNTGLTTPDTWEVALSGGADKKETFERLMLERKLFGLAFLRNLRNMQQAGVSEELVESYSLTVDLGRVLPFRFIAAANAVPQWESIIERMMLRCLEGSEKLQGKTVILVDISGSMDSAKVSAKSDLTRADAAYALAILIREVCAKVVVVAYSDSSKIVADRRGFGLRDAIKTSMRHNGTDTGGAVSFCNNLDYNRLIVITDEQSRTQVPNPLPNTEAYFINVANAKNGVGYGKWTHIDGWSESIVDYIRQSESLA